MALFILWQHLPGIFIDVNTITYKQYCWDLWSKYEHFLSPYIKALATNIQNLQQSIIDVILDMVTRQINAEASQSIEIDDLFTNPEVEANSDNLSDNDQIRIFSTLKESVFFVSPQ